jgi:myosin heavy subunit
MCNLAGSICETFLFVVGSICETFLFVVGRDGGADTMERNFLIFYQLLAAPENDKQKIWKGLVGKDGSNFNCVGVNPEVDSSYTNENAWKTTIAALYTVDVHGQELQCLLRALCIVVQLGNITFHVDPGNPEGSIVNSKEELNDLADLLGVDSEQIAHCLTYKTVKAVYDKLMTSMKFH